ncbi:EF-P 5-aminopentanol modification-associated protein YfmH [Periweissella fabalis]|uniref:Insulinase family protein n=1 Tax=Periweissella fabalis TaxID=1070421 RepID=A0A7X6N257_9LACO|nr:pitrilysin family protein [Periweissella fabalis]MCM0598675.1 insulinase family protein [Periweissella fabalis]NKZ24328.1 insulinase family protein [Periweissella fabalis]
MKQINYPNLEEKLYTKQLTNGLTVNLLPKKGFHKTYAVMTTDFGALDLSFIPIGDKEMQTMPAGIAHFLEHKLFEKADYDAFALFGKYGANANAYTSFTRTSYLFSTTRRLHENLDILLDFVQDPYFSKESVAKEQGIIGQEIQMYADEPNWQVYTNLLGAMYPNQALSEDIAGTIPSIEEITPEMLYTTYATFYQPSNMNLFIVGNFDVTETLTWIEANQTNKKFVPAQKIKRGNNVIENNVIPEMTLNLNVQRPKVAIGIRGYDQLPAGIEGLKYSLAISLAFDLLFGDTGKHYQTLYNNGIIDDSFSYDFEAQRGFHFATISSETQQATEFKTNILDILTHGFSELSAVADNFDLIKKEALGSNFGMLNSLEAIANQYDGELFDGANLLDEVGLLENLTFTDVLNYFKIFIDASQITTITVQPREDNN